MRWNYHRNYHRNYHLLVAVIAATGVARSQEILTLEGAQQIARQNNAAIRLAESDLQIAQNNTTRGNAGFLPKVDATAGFGGSVTNTNQEYRTGEVVNRNGATATNYNAGVGVSWIAFDGFRMFNAYDQLQKREELANAGLESAIEDVAWRVAVAWYDVVRQQQQLRVLRQSITMSEERLRWVEMKYEVGENSKRELLPAKVDLNSDRSAALRQEATLRNAKAALNLLLVRDPATEFTVPDTILLDQSLDETVLRQEAIAANRQLRAARIARQLASLGVDEARAGYYPRLGLNLGYNFTGSSAEASFINSNTSDGLTYGATASLNLFDGFNTSRQMENAQIEIQAAELQYQDAERAVTSQLAQAFITWRSRLELVKLERENVGIAEQSLGIAQERFNVGTIIPLELREAQTALTEARSRLLAALYDAYRSQVDLMRMSGRL